MARVITIDCHYLERPRFAAAYLLVEGQEAAFVDNNTSRAVPRLLEALGQAGLAPEQVRYLIITHVHLDHAGGTSALARACPQATVLAHPRAAPHIVNPQKLVASATAVYGAERFARMYGTIEAVAESRVRVMEDEATLAFGNSELTFLHTRGHANHHFCIADDRAGNLFTGDAFGLHYPDLQRHGTFAFPSTSPTDFDAELARQSVRRIVDRAPARCYPTHFGAVTDLHGAAGQLLSHLDFAEALLADAQASDLPDEALSAYADARLRADFAARLENFSAPAEIAAAWELLDLDIDLNAQGIAFAAAKGRRKARETRG